MSAETSTGYLVQFTDSYGCRRERCVTLVDEFVESGHPCVLVRVDAYWRRGGIGHQSAERVEADTYCDHYAGYVYAPEVDTPLAGYYGITPRREVRDGWVSFRRQSDRLGGAREERVKSARKTLKRFARALREHSEWNVCDCSQPDHACGRNPHDVGCAVHSDYWFPQRPEPWSADVEIAPIPDRIR